MKQQRWRDNDAWMVLFSDLSTFLDAQGCGWHLAHETGCNCLASYTLQFSSHKYTVGIFNIPAKRRTILESEPGV